MGYWKDIFLTFQLWHEIKNENEIKVNSCKILLLWNDLLITNSWIISQCFVSFIYFVFILCFFYNKLFFQYFPQHLGCIMKRATGNSVSLCVITLRWSCLCLHIHRLPRPPISLCNFRLVCIKKQHEHDHEEVKNESRTRNRHTHFENPFSTVPCFSVLHQP